MSLREKIGEFAEDMTPLRFFFFACALYGAVQVGGRWFTQKQRQDFISQAINEGDTGRARLGLAANCKDKKCITVFLAPWCPVCKSTESTLFKLHQMLPSLRPEMGLSIIVSDDTSQKLVDKKNELKPLETFMDVDGSLRKLRGVKGYPTWVIIDEKGQQIYSRSGGIQAENKEDLEKLLSQFLKI